MGAISYLYEKEVPINDYIHVMIPTVGEILDDEAQYYSIVRIITGMPIDFMVELDDAGIDFTTIDEFDLFLLMFQGIKNSDTHLIFGDLDLSRFEMAVNKTNNMVVLHDEKSGATIDKAIHGEIANTLRRIHNIKKDRRKPGNKEAQEYMIERARRKMKRQASKKPKSQLEELIVALVNTEQYKYDYEGTRGLSIYQFNESLQQVVHKVHFDNLMIGIYAGTVSAKEISQDELNWLTHKTNK